MAGSYLALFCIQSDELDKLSQWLCRHDSIINIVMFTTISLWLCWPPAIRFYRCSLDLLHSFSPPNLRDRLANRHQTLPHVQRWLGFIKFGHKFGWRFPRNLATHKHQNFCAISPNVATTWSRISQECNKASLIERRRSNVRTVPHRQT